MLRAVSFGLMGALVAPTIFAQGIDAGALQQNLQRQVPSTSPLNLPTPTAPRSAPEAKPDQATLIVKRFDLQGVQLLSAESVQEALQPWRDRPVTFDDLQRACEAVEALYRKRGYIVQAILPQQKIADGILIIQVIEAKLGAVIVDEAGQGIRFGKDRTRNYVLSANQIGKPLDTQAIARSVIILNEVPGVSVTSALEAGANEGETNLRVNLTETGLFTARVEANNYGSRSTGSAQASVSAGLNNPLRFGDQLSANGIYSEGSQFTQASYNFPVAANGLRAGVSANYLGYKNIGDYALNGGYGSASVLSANAAYPWLRSEGANVNLTAQFDNKTYLNKNILTDAVISNYQINSLNLGVSGNVYDGFFAGGVTNASLNLVLGQISALGASPTNFGQFQDETGKLSRITPSSYQKLTFSVNRVQTIVPERTRLLLNFSGQLASANLNSAEQFYLGGPYAVRAYPVAQGGGSQGALGSIELQHALYPGLMGVAFFDAGLVQQFVNPYYNWQGQTNANNVYSLMGTGVGFRYGYQSVTLAALVAWKVGNNPLYSQAGIPVNTDNTNTNPRGWLTASYQF
jgi:hemolysin activation/secretion protein